MTKTCGFCGIFKNDGRRGRFEEDLHRCIFRGRRSTRGIFSTGSGDRNRTKNMVMDSCGHGSMKRWTEKKLTERSKWMDEWLDRQKDRQFNR